MSVYDLHCHSTASDGSLAPEQLVEHFYQMGIATMALTDHDGVDGLATARNAASQLGMGFIDGIELSVSWQGRTIHIVGLCIDPEYPQLQQGIQWLKKYRCERAAAIAKELQAYGIADSLSGARKFSKGSMLGRMHFAQFLVAAGYCKDIRTVFKKFLVKNKPGHVKGQWATLQQAVSWIKGSGGFAVIAHPCRYRFKTKMLKRLIEDFMALGGDAIEVVSGSMSEVEILQIANIAQEYKLYASTGSDFHSVQYSWIKPGQLPPLPEFCTPIWHLWEQKR